MKRILKILCLIPVLLCGCGKKAAKPVMQVVTGVDISCQYEDAQISRHYTKSPKMEYALLYLRLLDTGKPPEIDPNTLDKPVFEIAVTLSDGSKDIYRQKAHRYFSKNGRPWQTIDPEQAAGLYRLIAKVPSDL